MKLFKFEETKYRTQLILVGIKITFKNHKIKKQDIYDEAFYEGQAKNSYKSAQEVLKIFSNIYPNVNSVIDIGCGAGTWLKVWQETNPDIQILGLDVNELPEDKLFVSRKNIVISDFEIDSSKEYINRKFDLVESLEVAEHLKEENANRYIELLCQLGDLILFSAALPHQTGTNHINEQPPQYWNEKFQAFGFECFDILRSEIWDNKNISWWYRQNILIFAKNEASNFLQQQGYNSVKNVNTYYHPELVKMHMGK